jgi:hypothetical protein
MTKVLRGGSRHHQTEVNYLSGGDIVVVWGIAENLTTGLTKDSARLDAVAILRVVRKSGITDYEQVRLNGWFPLVDEYGNSRDDRVVFGGFSRSTVERINYDGVDFKHIFDLADRGSVILPAFRY